MDCQECKASLFPEDPSQPFYDPRRQGFLKPLCGSCPDYRKVTREEQAVNTIILSSLEYQQLRAQMLNTQQKVNELYRKRKKKDSY